MVSQSSIREDFLTTKSDITASELNESLPSVANLLKNMRLKKKEKTRDIASSLRISERYLIAIEESDFKVLPEQVYTLGFVRAYAKYLDLASSEIIEQYKNENYPQARVPVLSFPEAALATGRPKVWIVVCAGILAVLVIVIWYFLNLSYNTDARESNEQGLGSENTPLLSENDNTIKQAELQRAEQDFKNALDEERSVESTLKPDLNTKAPVSENVQDSQAQDSLLEKTVVPQTSQETPLKNQDQVSLTSSSTDIEDGSLMYKDLQFKPGDKFTILATALSWLEIRNAQGLVLISRNLKPDEKVVFEAQPGMNFSTGNAGGIKFILQDRTTRSLGKNGEILRHQPLHFKLPQ
jgi:cytoskeleton protein RodZ